MNCQGGRFQGGRGLVSFLSRILSTTEAGLHPTPPLVLKEASPGVIWFRGHQCRNMVLPCLNKPVVQCGMYHGTHGADISQPFPFMSTKGCRAGQHSHHNTKIQLM